MAERDLIDGVQKYAKGFCWRAWKKNVTSTLCEVEQTLYSMARSPFAPFVAPFVGTVLGALLGYLAAGRLHKHDRIELEKGAARALLAEMLTNADRAISLSGTIQPVGFSDSVWVSQSPIISRLLAWKDLKKVVEAYDAGSRLSGESLRRDSMFLRALEKDEPNAHRVCLGVAEAFLNAIELLCGRKGLLNAAELSDLDNRLKQLRGDAASARELFIKGP